MKYFRIVLFAILTSLIASSLVAREIALPITKFSSTYEGFGNTGPISISGTVGRDEIKSLTVKVFAKTIDFEKEGLISQLKGIRSINGYSITYDDKPKNYKGRAINIVFSGFSQKIIVIRDDGFVNIISPIMALDN